MANFIETTTINPRQFVPVTSRYADASVIYYTENKLLTFKTYVKTPIQPNQKDKFLVITKHYEYRPDLVSFDVYGTPDFWWKIMEVNNIKDIFDFTAGQTIRLPDSVFI